jgi:hypothetical protein
MRIGFRIFTVFVCITLIACASSVPLQRGQIGSLSKDSTSAEVDRILADATVVAQFEFAVGEKSYFARHYNLLTGTRQDMTMVCTPNCMPVFYPVQITAAYVVIQRMPSKTMLAWGTLEELSKDSDPAISDIMPKLKTEFEAAKKKK